MFVYKTNENLLLIDSAVYLKEDTICIIFIYIKYVNYL